ncbi:MAG TPA: PIG-L family deacetylase [Bryobacteraceae bacterium]|nr:PIG-L family deacetylase [Bryobacteraceae bacterium]
MLVAALVVFSLIAFVPGVRPLRAQSRLTYSLVSPDSGHVALGLALRKLSVSGTFMQAPAHPDDETNALFAYFGYGMGLRVIDLQNNRGDGGQNEIGPELFRDIAVLRTSELLAAHRVDGAEQYFTRAIDYGYSFDPQEVIAKWGRKEIVGDYVRLLRTLRPDVVVTMNIQGRGGDRAHEATTILTREGYLTAGDPNQYPEQIAEGLRPWQPKKLYFSAGFGVVPPGGRGAGAAPPEPQQKLKLTPVNTAAYDSLLGRTYQEIGSDARSYHKCQGMGSFLAPLPGTGGGRGRGPAGYQLMETSIPGEKGKDEKSLFDGIDTSLTSIAQYAGPNPPDALTSALATILADAKLAQSAFADGNDTATVAPIEAGLKAIRALRAQLAEMHLSASGLYEVDFRLNTKEHDYEDALIAAHGLTFDALADDGLVIPGQPIKLSITAQNRGASDVSVTSVAVAGFNSPTACTAGAVKTNAVFTCSVDAHIPDDAKPTTPYFHDDYWKHPENHAIQIFDPSVPFGVPFAPSPFRVTFRVKTGDVEIARELPVEFRYVKDPFVGDKRMELTVVPAFSVTISPSLMVVPAPAASSAHPLQREVHVSVTNGNKGAAQVKLALELPQGWKAVPSVVPINFAHEDESVSARFRITAPAHVKIGDYSLEALVTSPSMPSAKFDSGYQEIEYPHVERRQVMKLADTSLKVIDVKTVPNLNVGYIDGVGDQVPAAIEQLGARLTFIDHDELAWGDLSKYDAIITGVRAYERRADLRAYNRRLLDYANNGGTVIVQYNKMEFNQAEYGPYPAKVSGNRVSDEMVPVKVLVPNDPVFNFPNKTGPGTWAGWVQERGLYFLGEKDKRYIDLVSMTDSYKDNPGEKLGSMVEARTGKGHWIYLGLGLWRQLPAGTEGAYQLLANLMSLGNSPEAKHESALAAR